MVVWETIAQKVPWHGLQNVQIVCAVGLRRERLPLNAVGAGDGAAPLFDDFMRQLCTDCWLEDPEARPSFATISERFTAYMTRKIQGNQKK